MSERLTSNFPNTRSKGNNYILGPGDSVLVDIENVPEYSGVFTIGPDGTLYLPRIRDIHAEGLTVNDLKYLLKSQYLEFLINPIIYVAIKAYRPIRVFVTGEVQRPGYYYLSGLKSVPIPDVVANPSTGRNFDPVVVNNSSPGISNATLQDGKLAIPGSESVKNDLILPTVFDAIRNAGGVTPYSNLEEVIVIRDQPVSSGGGKIRTSLDFLSLITSGNESQNIKVFDNDIIKVSRANKAMREQIVKASQTNLSPDFIRVFVTGRVRQPGPIIIPQGASLQQALAAAGGTKILRGTIEFARFNKDGTSDTRQFFGVSKDSEDSYSNPILMSGDIIRVNNSPLSAASSILGEITAPALGAYALYDLININGD